MAKVILSFYNGMNSSQKIPVFYDGLIRSLVRNGNSVLVISANEIMETKPDGTNTLYSYCSDKKFTKAVDDFAPDLIIAFNGSIPAEILDDSRCPVLVWEADSILYFNNRDILKKRAGDFFFGIVSSHSGRQLKEALSIPPSRLIDLPFATDLRALELPQTIGVSFIGSNFGGSGILLDFIRKHGFEDNCALKSMINELKTNPMTDAEEYSRRLESLDGALAKYFSMGYFHHLISNESRIDILNEIRDLGLRLFGNKDWLNLCHTSYELALCFDREEICGVSQNEKVYNSSKLCLNINHAQAVTALPWRIRDVMATNGCLVSEKKQDFSAFGKDVAIPTFSNKYEAREICVRLLEDEPMRREIVAASQREIERAHRFEHRFAVIKEVIGVNLCPGGVGTLKYFNSKDIWAFDFAYESKKIRKEIRRNAKRVLRKIF